MKIIMEVSATSKNIRISPEKVRLVVAQIKKMPPSKALQILDFVNKSTSPVLKKVIKSAIANAKNNHGLPENALSFKEILVSIGPVLKRYQPVSRGRVHHILKRTSSVKVVLETKQKKIEPKTDDEKLKKPETQDRKSIKEKPEKGEKNGPKS